MHLEELCVPMVDASEPTYQNGILLCVNHTRIHARVLVDVVLVAEVVFPLLGHRHAGDGHKQCHKKGSFHGLNDVGYSSIRFPGLMVPDGYNVRRA